MFRLAKFSFFSILTMFLVCPAAIVLSAELPKDVLEKIDAAVASAYKMASAKLPCKVGASGKVHMLHWQEVDKCLSQAIDRVNWEALAMQLNGIRPRNVTAGDFNAAIENSLSKNALPFDQVFTVKNQQALLPLTNPILKYLPQNSLRDQPVIDRSAGQIGSFAGVFMYERAGGTVSGAPYRLALFQYVDLQGKIQVPVAKLLLDSFGVPYTKIKTQPGFRLPADKLAVKTDTR